MADDNKPSLRARRWVPPADPGGARSSRFGFGSYRFVFRLLGIPVLVVAGVLLYNGIRDRFILPECDSTRAKNTLAEVLRELNLEPLRYAPLKTVSSSNDQNVCSALLPLPDGANVAVDYTFYWQGGKANMTYSVARKPAGSS